MFLETRELYGGYRKKEVLHGVSMKAEAGKVTAVIGANAVGKSTLIKTIVGTLPLMRGSIILDGENIFALNHKERAKRIGYLMQEQSAGLMLTVFEMVLLGRVGNLSLRIPQDEVERVENVLQSIGIEQLSERYCEELSGGQRRLVSIAQTIIQEPKLLILDEPTANLDLQNEIEILKLIRAYTQQKKCVTLVTLHDLNSAARFADHLVLLKEGRVYRMGKPCEVLDEEALYHAYGVVAHVEMDEEGIPVIHVLDSVRTKKRVLRMGVEGCEL